ncbi:MAG: hypothetical protein ABI468_10165, partial [Candidatus Nanopelagicales bacterium]
MLAGILAVTTKLAVCPIALVGVLVVFVIVVGATLTVRLAVAVTHRSSVGAGVQLAPSFRVLPVSVAVLVYAAEPAELGATVAVYVNTAFIPVRTEPAFH